VSREDAIDMPERDAFGHRYDEPVVFDPNAPANLRHGFDPALSPLVCRFCGRHKDAWQHQRHALPHPDDWRCLSCNLPCDPPGHLCARCREDW